MPTRREILSQTATPLAFAGLSAMAGRRAWAEEPAPARAGFPDLIKDPAGILDLPPGFSYRVISKAGETMVDGLRVPAMFDGMAAFPGPNGAVILVRNHEMAHEPNSAGAFGDDRALLSTVDRSRLYDVGANPNGPLPLGGTTTVVYDPAAGKTLRQWLSLGGTLRNCAGGPTPWGTWLTCEETVQTAGGPYAKDHGWVFEVPVTAEPVLTPAVPLTGLGRWYHEAAAVDPRDGAVILTEDRADGCLYRFVPKKAGDLRSPGRLQALVVTGKPGCDTRNWQHQEWAVGETRPVTWVDIPITDRGDEMRTTIPDAARFARGEGLWVASDGMLFCTTSGGKAVATDKRGFGVGKGQVWKLAHGGAALTLYIQPDEANILENCDNITVSPNGHLILCEDSCAPAIDAVQHIVGVTPKGACYRLARNALNSAEFAGACFSPDGAILFVNIQTPGLTLAITGPWPK